MKTNQVIAIKPEEFFRSHVTAAVAQQRISVSTEIEFYLVKLLCEFIFPDKRKLDETDLWDEPLAILQKKALEASDESKRQSIFKEIGDTSLYISGYFQDFFNRKTFDISYYTNMGSCAYASVFSTNKDKVYRELADNFNTLVEVVAEVSDNVGPKNDQNLLATYDRWNKTQSSRLRRKLEKLGINPIQNHKNRQH